MTLETFWKNYGRELEEILGKAHKREADRPSNAIKDTNHYRMQEERDAIEDLCTLKMIYGEVVRMNNDDKIDSQQPLKAETKNT